MSSKHYDIAIIGGSLSACIAAALLAKQGDKVLFLRYREATASEWFHSSLFLEKLLGTLGGRSCFVAQRPIQVISRKARVTLNNDISLDNELCREFGQDGPAVLQWLEQLKVHGTQLENLLWENNGLPWPSFKTTASFKLLGIRRKINWAELDAPLTDAMRMIPHAAVDFVTDLMQGLAMQRINALSYAQAALLWAQVMRPENLKEPDFSELLGKRFEQFHGSKADLKDLERIDFNGSRWTGGEIKGGGQFTAATFLLGDTRWLDRFKHGKVTGLPSPQILSRQSTSSLTGQLSSLLATRVICGGETPLRLAIEEGEGKPCDLPISSDEITEDQLQEQLEQLAIEKSEKQLYGLILGADKVTEEQLRKQLEPALPFADYKLSEAEEKLPTQRESTTANRPQKLASLPIRIGANLYCADSNALLPEMGASGAALLGWTLAKNLINKRKPG
jgi:hypothetical protein